MGAEVIRIDNPKTGDTLSQAPLYFGAGGPSFEKRDETDLGIAFLKRSRAKKAITLDLKSAEGRGLFLRLVGTADVVVENFSVGVTERLGIDWPRLRAVNPRLVYCSLTRSEEHTSELQSLMRISYAVFCLKKKTKNTTID